MLTHCACGHLVRSHRDDGCMVEGCTCQTPHDRLAKRLNRRVSPNAISAVWCHEEGDLLCHLVGVAGDRRQTPTPRTPAICRPSSPWGRWRRPFQLTPLSTLRCAVCTQELPRWTARIAAEAGQATTPPAPTTVGQVNYPVADLRYPTRVLVAVSADPRRGDLSERDYQDAARRWSG